MSILLVLIPISLLLLGIAIAAFVWAVKRGQYDDLDTPALDILTDDARPAPPRDAPLSAHALAASRSAAQTHRDADEPGHRISAVDGIGAEESGADDSGTDDGGTDRADGAELRAMSRPARSGD